MTTFMRSITEGIVPNGLDGDQNSVSCWRTAMFAEVSENMRVAIWALKMQLAKMRPGMALAA